MKASMTKYPRVMLAAGASGSGKTMITCGILQALKNRGLTVSSFKCGPDYIDPLFHQKVIGTRAGNLDTFFTDEETTRYLFWKNASHADISVMEGVMGFYDGLAGTDTQASAYDLARVTGTPVVLIVNTKGMSLSVLAYLKGFLTYRQDSGICGVILNQMSPMMYPQMKQKIEKELQVRVLGYVPRVEDCILESRHLGLVLPDEVRQLEEKLQRLSGILEESLDLDGLLELAGTESRTDMEGCREPQAVQDALEMAAAEGLLKKRPVIAVARDEAFCFIYRDNLELLERMGAQIVEFSPIHDAHLPDDAGGVLLYGGYPELYAEQLWKNAELREEIRSAVQNGMPCMAECGGFMYLHKTMEDMQSQSWEMAGVIDGCAYRTEKLGRFGYITLEENGGRPSAKETQPIRGHEFHYFDSTACGESYVARKPLRKRSWKCIHKTENLMAGFPHLYYYSSPQVALEFVRKCAKYK